MMKFTVGCMWEGDPWRIETEMQCSSFGGGQPCRHCHSARSLDRETTWTCPAVVIATNEGGYNSTGMCLSCILEGALAIGFVYSIDHVVPVSVREVTSVDQAQAQAHSVTSSS